MIQKHAWFVIAATLVAQGAVAQPPGIHQEDEALARLQAQLRIGAPVAVADAEGRETSGRLEDVGPSGIRLRLSEGMVEFPPEQIVTVRRDGDPLWNGVLWGGVWGAAVALSCVSHVDCQTCSHWEAAAVFLILGGGGAGLGGLFDQMNRDRSVLRRRSDFESVAVRPSPSRDPTRLSISVGWRF